jgi:hypothetical protein
MDAALPWRHVAAQEAAMQQTHWNLLAPRLGESDPVRHADAADAVDAPTPPAQFPDVISVSDLDGDNGFKLTKPGGSELLGFSAASAGDINGDGYDDLIIGTLYDAAYVVFGSAGGFAPALNVGTLDGTKGFKIEGATFSYVGRSVSGAGDINGDGFDDLVVGGPLANAHGHHSGAAYVMFGKASGFDAAVQAADLHGSGGFALSGAAPYDYAGAAVSSAGDINGDGYDDVIVGSDGPGGDSGPSYVVFGHAGGFARGFSLDTIDGSNGFKLSDGGPSDIGAVVAAAGDVNGDGLGDIIVGAPADSAAGTYAGAAYVVFGKSSPFSASIDLSALTGADGFRMDGSAYSYAANSVASAGDINGDGFADLIVGEFHGEPGGLHEAGYSHVVFGHAGGFDPVIDLEALDGTNGFTLDGVSFEQDSGFSVSSAGDVNGDGFDDLLIGAPYTYSSALGYVGGAYVMFGGKSGFDAHVSLDDLSGTKGFRIEGSIEYGQFGFTVTSAGDINGDGLDDLMVAAPTTGHGYDGQVYVVLGRLPDAAVHLSGTAAGQTLVGGDFADGLKARAGDDVLWGHGENDALAGGRGDDTLIGGEGRDNLVGGDGNDVFRYLALSDSNIADRDTIRDLKPDDVIDLSAIDANANRDGDQAFHLVAAFTGHVGELELIHAGANTQLRGDVDGDGVADLVIRLTGDQTAFTDCVL